ncbi:MAG: IgGFc-binding protein [Ignavibacteria bacterium]|jgi:hypothetical protein|nr:IgGFc-binding protein [Ignavibacteria bacterium]
MKKNILILLLLIIPLMLDAKPSAMQGRHFIVGFMQNEIERQDMSGTFSMSVFISAIRTDTVVITIPNEPIRKEVVAGGQIFELKIDPKFEIKQLGVIQNKLIEISSQTPLIVWCYSSKNQSSESYVALPVSIWNNEYRAVSMPNDQYYGPNRLVADGACDSLGNIIDQARYDELTTPRSGEFLVIASLDSTIVTYIPTCSTLNGANGGDTQNVRLNKGEALFVQAMGGAIGTYDLTGTLIKSNNPIGVISGHVRSSVKQGLDNPYDTKDHLLEMLPPTKTWGRRFISVPFVDGQNIFANNYYTLCANGDMYKVIAKEDNTHLKWTEYKADGTMSINTATIAKAGDCLQVEVSNATLWEADSPILLSQFMMHLGIPNKDIDESLNYDPAYVILAPIEQYIEEVTFSTPSNYKVFDQYKAHCVIVITDTFSIYDLWLDGKRFDALNASIYNKRIGNSGYAWSMKVLPSGTHRLSSDRKSFSGIIYGHGFRDSYSMALGSRLNDPYHIDTIPPMLSITDSCGKFHIVITDIQRDDANATGIDWGYVRNVVNYSVSPLVITDTSTTIILDAEPIDKSKDGSFNIEFTDKNDNVVERQFSYSGVNIDCPTSYNFGMLKWNTPTVATLEIKNNSTVAKMLTGITLPSDIRLVATSVALPYLLQHNETITLTLTFTPIGTLDPLNTSIKLIFECKEINIAIEGKISAPGLLADNLDFGKVRLYDAKTLSGRLHNAGNIVLVVDSIAKDIVEPKFDWSYNKAFPATLAVNDSLRYTVTFTPTENRDYLVNADVVDDNGLSCGFYVKGRGAAPEITNRLLEWGRRRIGTTSDTMIFVRNIGNYDDTIAFLSNYSLTHPLDKSVDSMKMLYNQPIAEQDSIKLNFSFTPTDTFELENIFELSSKWVHHPAIYVIVKATGTIPIIQANDYNFGDVPIYSTITAQHNIVQSLGNEELTIDSIVFLGGDSEYFDIDYAQMQNLVIPISEQYILPITYHPNVKGTHKILLEITHDANPNYARSKDTVQIVGNCVTDNPDYVFSLAMPEVHSCKYDTAVVTLENNGNAKLVIDSAHIACVPLGATAFFVDDLLPAEIEPSASLQLPIVIYAEREQFATMSVNTYYNGDNVNVQTAEITPLTTTITSSLILSTNTIFPGDTLQLLCRADFGEIVDKLSDIDIKLHIDTKLFYCLEKKCYIICSKDEKEQTIEKDLIGIDDEFGIILSAEERTLGAPSSIEFVVKLLPLLTNRKNAEFNFAVTAADCYAPQPAYLAIELQAVCADTVRQFILDGFSYFFVKQNPVTTDIEYTINLVATDDVEVDDITLKVTDLLGNVVKEVALHLQIGKHQLHLPTTDLANGMYFITANGHLINSNCKLLIVK